MGFVFLACLFRGGAKVVSPVWGARLAWVFLVRVFVVLGAVYPACAGRVDKWKGREREPVSVGSLSLFFSSFVERMTGLEPAAFTLGG